MSKSKQSQDMVMQYSARLNTGKCQFNGGLLMPFKATKYVKTPMQRAKAFVRGLLNTPGDWKVELTVNGEFEEFVCEVVQTEDGTIFRHDHAA